RDGISLGQPALRHAAAQVAAADNKPTERHGTTQLAELVAGLGTSTKKRELHIENCKFAPAGRYRPIYNFQFSICNLQSSIMPRISLVEALKVLHSLREERDVVLATMGAAREWMKLGTHPLDFIYAPSAMGEAPALGLGMALAQPG